MRVSLGLSSLSALAILLPIAAVHAQTPVFASRYTDLKKDCDTPAWFLADKRTWEARHPGKEYPEPPPESLDCKPVGAWRATIDWSAVSMVLRVVPLSPGAKADAALQVGERLGEGRSAGALEWRLADGKPFAVIFRTQAWRENPKWTSDGKAPQYIVSAEKIVVRGLSGFTALNLEIPANDTQANIKARAAADAAFGTQSDVHP